MFIGTHILQIIIKIHEFFLGQLHIYLEDDDNILYISLQFTPRDFCVHRRIL